jgi:hypothetical protein
MEETSTLIKSKVFAKKEHSKLSDVTLNSGQSMCNPILEAQPTSQYSLLYYPLKEEK